MLFWKSPPCRTTEIAAYFGLSAYQRQILS
ncbi:FaeA/PapI family transcriptional regulator [Salmonella enterica]|nr:FaeA/PapI family transcriptional regulator [Salmonella enterica]ECR7711327.1 hypothetical protein [Salmonella enterica]ECY7128928.1 hypothetical protein [Salmonella enterica]